MSSGEVPRDALAAMPPAECWVVEPPEPPVGFSEFVGYLLNAGVDVAFGPDDRLPADLPSRYDEVRCLVVCAEDLPRLRRGLRGFRGLDPDSDEPPELQEHGTMFLHENEVTWLAVWTEYGRRTAKRIENPLIVAPDLTVDSSRLRNRLLARPDEEVHAHLLAGLADSTRFEWSDVSFGTLWALVGAYEATGEDRYLTTARWYVTAQLEYAAEHPHQRGGIFSSALPLVRLSQLTADAAYTQLLVAGVPQVPHQENLLTGGPYLLQAHSFVHPVTRRYLVSRAADGGTHSETVGHYYPSVLAVARVAGGGAGAADQIGQCLAEHRRNCRDERTGLYYHGLLGRVNNHRGFQGHGMLWTCFGLVHLVELWPAGHPAYGAVLQMFRDACRAAASVQDTETGEFHHILDIPQTPHGRIYTAALAYVFLRGARLGYLTEEFRDRGQAAWSAVKRHVFQGGSFGGDGGTPQSKRLEFYLLQPMNYDYRSNRTRCFWQAHAANEVLRLLKGR